MIKSYIATRLSLVSLLGLTLFASGSAQGQSRGLVEAFNRSSTLNEQGQYEEALPFAEEAVKLGSEEFGPNHSVTGGLLSNLGRLYTKQGRYADAEPLFKRALAILENDQGPGHPSVAIVLASHAQLIRATGRAAEAAQLESRAAAIRATQTDDDDVYDGAVSGDDGDDA